MKTEIITNKEAASLTAKRVFNADLEKVWRAFTEAELLDQWWAPKPWKCETISMEFSPKGKWLYDMVGPNGERHSAAQVFDEIVFEKYYSGIDAFTNEKGEINEDMPVAKWKTSFSTTDEGTLVIIESQYADTKALEEVLKMGMEEGMAKAQDNLDALLKTL